MSHPEAKPPAGIHDPHGEEPRLDTELEHPGEEATTGGVSQPLPILEPTIKIPAQLGQSITIVKPKDGPQSDEKRRKDLQEKLAKATQSAIDETSRLLTVSLYARKLNMGHNQDIGFTLKAWPLFSAEPNEKAESIRPGSAKDGYTISADYFKSALRVYPDPVKANYAVVDLRDPKNATDFPKGQPHLQIKNALHAPFVEEVAKIPLSYMNLGVMWPPIGSAKDIAIRQAWQEARQTEPWKSIATKGVVFFHCRQSTNRTPFLASGYLMYGRPEGSRQKVVILEKGYDNYDWGKDLTEPLAQEMEDEVLAAAIGQT